MKILSLLPTHNATVALFEDGKCTCYLQEEKFNNIKNFWGFPKKSLEYLDQRYNLSNLDYIVIPTKQLMWGSMPVISNNLSYKTEIFATSKVRELTNFIEYKSQFKSFFFNIRSYILDKLITIPAQKSMTSYLSTKYGINKSHILYLDHHTCHAYSPIHFYNLHKKSKPTLIFTLDGSGDNYCSKTFVYYPKNNHLKLVSSSKFDASIGLLYSGLTQFLGMKPIEHEYKVMGLAAYVTDKKYYQTILDKLRKDIWFDQKTLEFKSKFNTNYSFYYFKENFVGQRFDNLSAAVQALTEELILSWIEASVKKFKIKNIACVGGVFMNVKTNKKIQELGTIDKVYFMPSSSDDSLGYGAVFDLFMKHKIVPESDSSMFHGLEYSDAEVEDYIKQNKLTKKYNLKKSINIEKDIATLLSQNQIVSWFTGAGEWGARSLCNRTILANASHYSSYLQINDAIKMRDFWMPFAPTILDSWAARYIKDWAKLSKKVKPSSKYMITAFDTTPLAQKDLVASVHQKDKTIRPQLVEESDNPALFKMLSQYEKLTGMGGVLNTSLNIHGYPLVGSLDQAIFTLDNSHLTHLVINNYLISKKNV